VTPEDITAGIDALWNPEWRPEPFFLTRDLAEVLTLDELNSLGLIITHPDTKRYLEEKFGDAA